MIATSGRIRFHSLLVRSLRRHADGRAAGALFVCCTSPKELRAPDVVLVPTPQEVVGAIDLTGSFWTELTERINLD